MARPRVNRKGDKMRRIFMFTLLAFALTVLTQGTIMAQGIPQGSYQQTCNNVAVNGNVLSANCQDSRGNWINAQLPDVQRCGSDITNDNGVLHCVSSGTAPGGFKAKTVPADRIRNLAATSMWAATICTRAARHATAAG